MSSGTDFLSTPAPSAPRQPQPAPQPTQAPAQSSGVAFLSTPKGSAPAHFGAGASTPGNLASGNVPGVTASDKSANALLPTLRWLGDRLQTGQYVSANVLDDVLSNKYGDLWNAVKQGATGQRRGDYIDIVKQHFPNLNPAVANAVGFALDVGLDPTTYLTFGEGSMLKASLPFVGKVADVGKAPNVGAKIVDTLSHSPKGQSLLKTFHPAGQWAAIGGDQLGKDFLQSQRVMNNAPAAAIAQNIPLAQAQKATEKATGMSPGELATAIEKKPVSHKLAEGAVENEATNVTTSPPEGAAASAATDSLHPAAISLKDQFQAAEQTRLQLEKSAGIDVAPVQSDIVDYLSHELTPEAQKWKQDHKISDVNMESLYKGYVQHGSTKKRMMDMSIADANALSQAGDLGGMWKGFKGDLFINDPAVANTLRDIKSLRSIAAAGWIKRIATDPQYAVQIGADGKIPQGFRELTKTAENRYGPLVDGVAFRTDVADALDKYTARVNSPDSMDELSSMYQKMIRTWKPITLGISPKWMANNAGTNTFMLWLAGASPKSLATASTVFAKASPAAPAIYRVMPGDTLSQIAEKFGVSTDALAKKNGIANPDAIQAGRALAIPTEGGKIGGFTPQQVFALAQQQGILFGGLYGSTAQTAVSDAVRAGLYGEKQGKTVLQRAPRLILDANAALENYGRMALFVDGLQKGMKPAQAAQRVDKYLGNFAQMSVAGKKMSAIVPFWSWIRFAMPRMLEQLKTHPGRQAMQFKAITAMQSNQPYVEPRAVQRDYAQNELKAQIGYSPTTPKELNLNSALPMSILTDSLPTTNSHTLWQAIGESAGRTLETLGAASNPLYNAVQAARGYDTFRNEQIPIDQTTEFFGHPVNTRLVRVVQELLPPVAAADRLFSPHQTQGVQKPTVAERAANVIGSYRAQPMVTLRPTLRGAAIGGDVEATITHLNTLVDKAYNKAELAPDMATRQASLNQAENLAKQISFVVKSTMKPGMPAQVGAALSAGLSNLSKTTQALVTAAMLQNAMKSQAKNKPTGG